MTTAAWVLLTVAAVAGVTNWLAVARSSKRVEYVAKPLTMAALVGVALTLEPVDPSRRAWFVAAGVFCLAGDVFLMLPRDRFIPGVVAFLLGHLCYIPGLLSGGAPGGGAAVGGLVVVAMVIAVGRPVLLAVLRRRRDLFIPIVVYMAVISAMVLAAFAAGPALALGGALLFYASDGVLATQRFVRETRWAPVVVMVTYHLGQAGLMTSLVQGS